MLGGDAVPASRATGVAGRTPLDAAGAIVGSLSGGIIGLNFSFDTRCFCHCYSGGYQRGNAYPADGGCPLSISVPDDLPLPAS